MDMKTDVIRAELADDDSCSALGVTAKSSSPVIGLCRKLIDAGHNPATPLEAWRGDILCLCIRSIGEAARLQVNSHGTGFEPQPERRRGASVEFEGEGVPR
jgi:hypothetical protein